MSEFEIVTPEDPEYEVLDEYINPPSAKFNYNDFAEAYNKCDQGMILTFKYPGSTITNFHNMLKARGLVKNEDYSLRSTQVAADLSSRELKMAVKKLTMAKCELKDN